MEDEVAGLAQVAALGGDRGDATRVVPLDPVAGLAQLALGEIDRRLAAAAASALGATSTIASR